MKSDTGFEIDFRGGTMRVLNNNSDEILVDAHYRVAVTFEGLGLEMRQEKRDELYGNISVAIGSLQSLNHITIPKFILRPAAENRIYQTSAVLFDGRPNDIPERQPITVDDPRCAGGMPARPPRHRIQ